MLVQYGLVAEVGPTTAQMVTYFVPIIATAAGVAVLGEHLTWSTPVGALIVLAGAALTQARPKQRRTPARPKAVGETRATGSAPAPEDRPGRHGPAGLPESHT